MEWNIMNTLRQKGEKNQRIKKVIIPLKKKGRKNEYRIPLMEEKGRKQMKELTNEKEGVGMPLIDVQCEAYKGLGTIVPASNQSVEEQINIR